MSKGKGGKRVIEVDALARVEGEGALYVRLKGDRIEQLRFSIYEPPRFFEALLEGRDYSDAPDITARICGICPVAYLLGSSQAMESILGLAVSPEVRALRRLIYCGEWIASHVLHVFFLHAPDFLGYDDAIAMAKDHPEMVKDALRLKKIGNALLETIGGRAVHPVNLKVGGFYSVPERERLLTLRDDLTWGMETARALTLRVSSFDFPTLEQDYCCVSLHHPDEYAITEGRLVSDRGLDIPIDAFEQHFDETHVDHSTALHGRMRGREAPYLVGPLARYNNNREQLSDSARALAEAAGLGARVANPFKSIVVRMVEVFYAFEEALRLVDGWTPPAAAAVEGPVRAGQGSGCTEAPRGICYHRYVLDREGRILKARIVPPTSQNQPQMEADLRALVQRNLALPDDELQWLCEQNIRNYDPCISCATHFLRLTVERDARSTRA